MKIGIEGSPLAIPFPCGVKHYAVELLNALAKIDSKNEYVIFASRKVVIPKKKNFRLVVVRSYLPFFKRQLFLSKRATDEKLDVFHYLEPFGSVFFRHPNMVTTVNDIDLDIIYPKFRSLLFFLKRYYCGITRYFVSRHTKSFIAISDFTGVQLKRYLKGFGISGRSVTTVYDAPSDDYKQIKVKKENFILSMGDFSPRKNVRVVIDAYSRLPERLKNKHELRIVVSTKQEVEKFMHDAQKYGVSERVKFDIGVTNRQLAVLYNKAAVFIYPSLYEGFGLPIVEAMSCGCPVITSGFGATKEVAGNAALLTDSRKVNSVLKSLLKVLGSKSIRDRLIKKGLARAKEFSWEKTARKTISVYSKFQSPG